MRWMKHLPVLVLFVIAFVFVGLVITTSSELPEKIASGFNQEGVAIGWQNKSTFTGGMLAYGFGLPAFVLGIMYSIRFFPARFLNLPNAKYWREPENYKKACAILFSWSQWFACGILIWQIFFFKMIVNANQVFPPLLDNQRATLLTIALLVFSLVWVIALCLRFLRLPKEG